MKHKASMGSEDIVLIILTCLTGKVSQMSIIGTFLTWLAYISYKSEKNKAAGVAFPILHTVIFGKMKQTSKYYLRYTYNMDLSFNYNV